MTDERIKEIRERLGAATPGPWSVLDLSDETGTDYTVEGSDVQIGPVWALADAAFIANAPADIAYLLEQVERLERAFRDLESMR